MTDDPMKELPKILKAAWPELKFMIGRYKSLGGDSVLVVATGAEQGRMANRFLVRDGSVTPTEETRGFPPSMQRMIAKLVVGLARGGSASDGLHELTREEIDKRKMLEDKQKIWNEVFG